MTQFDKTKEYYFVGNANLIEGISLYVDSEIVYLGKFLGHVCIPCSDNKARFETGILSKVHYENIHVVKST